MITDDFVSVEIQELLNKKGFDFHSDSVQAIGKYDIKHNDDGTSEFEKCCTYQMAMKWLRKVHNIVIVVTPSMFWVKYNACIYKKGNDYPIGFDVSSLCPSYEHAVEAAIKYCLENLI